MGYYVDAGRRVRVHLIEALRKASLLTPAKEKGLKEVFRYTGNGGISSIHFSKNGLDGTMSWLEGGAIAVPAGSSPPPTVTARIVKTYQTHDGGAHWQLAFTTTEDNPPKTQPQPEYAPGFASAAFYLDNDREGCSIRIPTHPTAHDALVMRNSDAGRTWTQIGDLPGTVNCYPNFRDSKNGWCTEAESPPPTVH